MKRIDGSNTSTTVWNVLSAEDMLTCGILSSTDEQIDQIVMSRDEQTLMTWQQVLMNSED